MLRHINQKINYKESKGIDIIKAISVLSVIAAHTVPVSNSGLLDKTVSFLWNQFGHVGVAAFFIIGGFLYRRSENDSAAFWKKKLFRIIIPWLFCSSFVYLVNVFLLKGQKWQCLSYFKWIFGSGTLYYFATVYTLFIFIFKWFYKNSTILCCFIGLQFVSIILTSLTVKSSCTPVFLTNYLNPLNWIGYFSIGIIMRRYRIDRLLQEKKVVCFIVSAVSVTATLFILYIKNVNTYFNLFTMLFCLTSFALTSLMASILTRFRRISGCVRVIGTYSYCIYLLHLDIVQSLISRIPDGIGKIMLSPLVGLAVMLVLIKTGLFLCKYLPFGNKIKMLVGL